MWEFNTLLNRQKMRHFSHFYLEYVSLYWCLVCVKSQSTIYISTLFVFFWSMKAWTHIAVCCETEKLRERDSGVKATHWMIIWIGGWLSSRLADLIYWPRTSSVRVIRSRLWVVPPISASYDATSHWMSASCIFRGWNCEAACQKADVYLASRGRTGHTKSLNLSLSLEDWEKLQRRSRSADFLSAFSRVALWLSVAGRGGSACMSGPQETWKSQFVLRAVFMFLTRYSWCVARWFQPFLCLSACPLLTYTYLLAHVKLHPNIKSVDQLLAAAA